MPTPEEISYAAVVQRPFAAHECCRSCSPCQSKDYECIVVVGYVDIGYGSEGVAAFTGLNYPF